MYLKEKKKNKKKNQKKNQKKAIFFKYIENESKSINYDLFKKHFNFKARTVFVKNKDKNV